MSIAVRGSANVHAQYRGAPARLSGLRVVSRTSSFRFRGHDADVREIGRDLGVGAIVEGSVRRSGARLRITAQLTNTASGYNIWSGRFDRDMTDVFAIQDEIVESIVSALAPALRDEAALAVRRSTENLEADELYLKGRHLWNQRSPVVMSTATGAFEEAIELDPAYAGLRRSAASRYPLSATQATVGKCSKRGCGVCGVPPRRRSMDRTSGFRRQPRRTVRSGPILSG